jgi:hypothetical protein
MQRMKVSAIKMPVKMLAELKLLAHQESVRQGYKISWGSLVRNAISQQLLANTELAQRPLNLAS